MKHTKLTAALLCILAGTPAFAATAITSNQLTTLKAPGWTVGSQGGGSVRIDTVNKNPNTGSPAIIGSYPSPGAGAVYVWGAYDLSGLKTRDIYIEFWARMPGAKNGFKFLKVFGETNNGQAANSTFGLDYTGIDNGYMAQVSFGDGSTPTNDAQNVIHFDGSDLDWIGRSYGKARISTPQGKVWSASNWGTSWHHFKVRVKFNSGTTAQTEVADGAYYVEIDNKVYVDASGILNRHYSNGPIDRVELFGWAQGGNTPAFEIWYSDVTISTGGFMSTAAAAAPTAPNNFSAQPVK